MPLMSLRSSILGDSANLSGERFLTIDIPSSKSIAIRSQENSEFSILSSKKCFKHLAMVRCASYFCGEHVSWHKRHHLKQGEDKPLSILCYLLLYLLQPSPTSHATRTYVL